MWIEIIAGAFIGSILSAVITAYFERLRRPVLSFKIVSVQAADFTGLPRPAKKAQFLYVALVNNDLNKMGKWFSTRETASPLSGSNYVSPPGWNKSFRKRNGFEVDAY